MASPPPAADAEYSDSSDEEQAQLEKDRKAFGTIFTKTTKDPKQPLKKVDWVLVDPLKVDEDVRASVPGASLAPSIQRSCST